MSDTLVEIARRRAGRSDGKTVIDDLREGCSVDDSAVRRGFPRATVAGVRSFYEFLHDGPPHRCSGSACRFPGGGPGGRAGGPPAEGREVRCVGRCYQAPVVLEAGSFPVPRTSLAQPPIVFRHLLGPRPPLAELYALPEADAILDILEHVGLRGRGGAAYPTAAKWRAARAAHGAPKYVVANGDEGDPGSFVDRLLLEEDPHAILAGLQACARAVGAVHAVVYIRAEYPRAAEVVGAAIVEARAAGVLERDLHVEVHVGAGSYVCGEETALLRAIEGLRAEPNPKPPYPAQRGLFGKPTVVQNVETLAIVPELLRTQRRSSTKAFSISGAVAVPAAVEAELGTPLTELLERGAGGARAGARWKMALVGGPMGSVVPAAHFDDVKLGYDTFPRLGHGGIVVLDDDVAVRALAEHLFSFATAESCGACTPCRVGTSMLASRSDRSALERLLDTLEMGSMCGFGLGVPAPIRDLLKHFPDELFAGSAGDT
ncbi:MAG: NADH-ubiquinone oxidoreductase-F iron-sulfur binding region domain-containing protein [Deltaproteobacteria bacterium]|nr:NADH-ubiquinone oxidoreductase-F iron-sulfur binding region domain-containing protein [Deltaproteobacteria bacterium]